MITFSANNLRFNPLKSLFGLVLSCLLTFTLTAQQTNSFKGWISVNNTAPIGGTTITYGNNLDRVNMELKLIGTTTTVNALSTLTDTTCPDPITGLDRIINYIGPDFTVASKGKAKINAFRVFEADIFCLSMEDIDRIGDHILNTGDGPFDDAFLLLAADANQSGDITSLDQLLIRRVILGIESFPNGFWGFVPKRLLESNPFRAAFLLDPFNTPNLPLLRYPDYTDGEDKFTVLPTSVIPRNNFDFAAYKLGDVVNDFTQNLASRISSNRAATIKAFDSHSLNESEVTLSILVDDFASARLFGTGIKVNENVAELISVSNSDLPNFDENTYSYRNGNLKVIWMDLLDDGLANIRGKQTLFEIHLQLKQPIKSIGDIISFDNDVLPTEFYGIQEKIGNPQITVELVKTPTSADATLAITPNPATTFTYLDLHLNTAGQGHIQVFDLAGKLLKDQVQYFQAGQQQYRLDDLQAFNAGIYLVKVKVGDQVLTQKFSKL